MTKKISDATGIYDDEYDKHYNEAAKRYNKYLLTKDPLPSFTKREREQLRIGKKHAQWCVDFFDIEPDIWWMMAGFEYALQRYKESYAWKMKLVDCADDPYTILDASETAIRIGKLKSALELARKAKRLENDCYEAFFQEVKVLLLQKQGAAALRSAREMNKRWPKKSRDLYTYVQRISKKELPFPKTVLAFEKEWGRQSQ